MSRFWSSVVAGLDPYVPGEQPKVAGLVKLNTNEHPWGPSPKALSAIAAATNDDLRLYPDPSSDRLRAAIAAYHGVTPECVFVGNGSDEVLAHVFIGLLKHARGPLRFPDISYSFYPVYCKLFGIDYETVALDDQFVLAPEAFDAFDQPAGGIIFPNPNAPTGIALARDQIESILARHPDTMVVVDEAYVDFGAESAVPLCARYDNVLTVHTLSKSRSLAGLRVGYAIGSRPLIDGLERVKNSFNSFPIDRLAEAGAVAAFEDVDYFRRSCEFVMAQRAEVTEALRALGFVVLPSHANFVFASHPDHAGEAVASFLRSRNVLVRHFKKARIQDFLRISIGSEQQNAALITALKDLSGH